MMRMPLVILTAPTSVLMTTPLLMTMMMMTSISHRPGRHMLRKNSMVRCLFSVMPRAVSTCMHLKLLAYDCVVCLSVYSSCITGDLKYLRASI